MKNSTKRGNTNRATQGSKKQSQQEQLIKIVELFYETLMEKSDNINYTGMFKNFQKMVRINGIEVDHSALKKEGFQYLMDHCNAISGQNRKNSDEHVQKIYRAMMTKLDDVLHSIQSGELLQIEVGENHREFVNQTIREASLNADHIISLFKELMEQIASSDPNILTVDEENRLDMKSLIQDSRKLRAELQRRVDNRNKTPVELAQVEKQKQKQDERQKAEVQQIKEIEARLIDEGVDHAEIHPFARQWASYNPLSIFDVYKPDDPRTDLIAPLRNNKKDENSDESDQSHSDIDSEHQCELKVKTSEIKSKFRSASSFVTAQKNLHDNYPLTYGQIESKYPHKPSLYNMVQDEREQSQGERENEEMKEELQSLSIPVSKDSMIQARKLLEEHLRQNQKKEEAMLEKLNDHRNFFNISYANQQDWNQQTAKKFLNLLQWSEEGMRFEVCGGILFSKQIKTSLKDILTQSQYFTAHLQHTPSIIKVKGDALAHFFNLNRAFFVFKPIVVEKKRPRLRSILAQESTRQVEKSRTQKPKKAEVEDETLKREVDRTLKEKINPLENGKLVRIMKEYLEKAKKNKKLMSEFKEQLARLGIEVISK